MNLILQAIKSLFRKLENKIDRDIVNNRSDWEQNDENGAGYIKNRTHYIDNGLIFKTTIEDNRAEWYELDYPLLEGEIYTVNYNGEVYMCNVHNTSSGQSMLGNHKIYSDLMGDINPKDTGEPFCFALNAYLSEILILRMDSTQINISIIGPYCKTIDRKYLPNDIFTKCNSFSMGRINGSVIGECSHAEGYDTTASRLCSHAEGYGTTASGDFSHAECAGTTASGGFSHAEGNDTTASGNYSHAEGNYTTASGDCSHAEGWNTTASGNYSHAEGNGTTASGNYSHAEGIYSKEVENSIYGFNGRRAKVSFSGSSVSISRSFSFNESTGEFVLHEPILKIDINELHLYFGYAIIDDSNNLYVIRGLSTDENYPYDAINYFVSSAHNVDRKGYLHCVGNGLADNARSNAHTIDYFGNAWYSGDVYVGSTSGTNKDEGSKKLATEEFVYSSAHSQMHLADKTTGFQYIIAIDNGSLVSAPRPFTYIITTIPATTTYTAGEYFDAAGLATAVVYDDGSSKEITDYHFPAEYLAEGTTEVAITATILGSEYSATTAVTVTALDPATYLANYTYTDNGDGTYTVTGWADTTKTDELTIPNNYFVKMGG